MIKLRSLILNTINIRCIKRMKNNIFGGVRNSTVQYFYTLTASVHAVCNSSPKPLRASHAHWMLYDIAGLAILIRNKGAKICIIILL